MVSTPDPKRNPVAKNRDACIDLHDVVKVYRGRIRALDGMSMKVERGETFGLLGPNGAGKSTLVKIIMTIVHATQASGTVLGKRVGHKPTLARIGYLPEDHRFPSHLNGRQVLEYYAALSGVGRAARRKRSDELLDIVSMREWAKVPVSRYSKGMMQRVGIAQALMNDPELIILDEPTDGVDPVGRAEIRDLLLRFREEGRTVFINSHLLSEVERVCDRVAILMKGRVERQGTLDELTSASRRYEIECAGAAPQWVDEIPDLSADVNDAGRTVLRFPGHHVEKAQPVIDRLRREGVTIHRVEACGESLEELFIRAVRDAEANGLASPGGVRVGSGGPLA